MIRRVVVVVYFVMLVLVVAQAQQYEESSSSIGQLSPISSVASLPGDEDKSTPPAPDRDCDQIYSCRAKCWVFKHDPKRYAACLELCKKHCNDGHLSDAIYTCTFACADSMRMPTRQLASDHAVGRDNYVGTCFEKCKKNR